VSQCARLSLKVKSGKVSKVTELFEELSLAADCFSGQSLTVYGFIKKDGRSED